MIKKILLAILIALPLCGFAQSKFGVVDVQTIFTALPDVKEMQSQIEASSKTYETEFQKLNEEFNKKYTEFQQLDASTPESIKERRMQEIQELGQKIEQFRATASQDLQQQQEKLMAPIQQKIQDAIKAVGDEGSYTFIFENIAAAYVGKDVVDVTSLVKAKLGVK
ncbi:MAG: OmpH family outer membrane protein [Muribaculaceae bacterium]|nr:OmpH family outer membrane protein [Muribaculaceae bacterium]